MKTIRRKGGEERLLSSFSEKAIFTKVKAMYGRRLTDAQYRALLHRRSVAEIVTYLRDETDYADVLADTAPTAVHRQQLEHLLRKHRYLQYRTLLRYDTRRGESYYRYPISEAEIEQLLQMMLLLNFGRASDYITQYPAYLAGDTTFSLGALARVRSLDELQTQLSGTPYEPLLRKCIPPGAQQAEIPRAERTLFAALTAHYDALARRIYGTRVGDQLAEIQHTRCELLNVSLIYRTKRYYPSTPSAELQASLLPDGGRIPRRTWVQWIAAPDADAFLQLLADSPYRSYIGSGDYVFIEYAGNCIRYHLNRRYLCFAQDAPVAFTAYMTLSELEIRNITTIVEGVRYAVPSEEIQKLLIR